MPKIKVYNLEGETVGEQELSDQIWSVPVNHGLVEQAVTWQMANVRRPIAHAKGRGEVRGGGRKPWRQKGTGRARHGSIRSPIWRGGGVTFGPSRDRNYQLKINKAMKRKALLMCLSDKLASQAVVLVEKFELPEIKTKKLAEVLSKLPAKQYSSLIVLKTGDQKIVKSARNLAAVKTVPADSLNVYDILNHKFFITDKEGLGVIEKMYKK